MFFGKHLFMALLDPRRKWLARTLRLQHKMDYVQYLDTGGGTIPPTRLIYTPARKIPPHRKSEKENAKDSPKASGTLENGRRNGQK